MRLPLNLTVNGVAHELHVAPESSLLYAIREQLGLTGSKEGCEDSECGACMMLVDGRPVNSCSYLALQANGHAITTVEGIALGRELHPLQRHFAELGAVQCGYCTSGMLISAAALLMHNPEPTEEEIRWAVSGNLCRCTGYGKIVLAVQAAANETRTAPAESPARPR